MSNPPVCLRHLYDIIPKDLRQPYTQRHTPFSSCQPRLHPTRNPHARAETPSGEGWIHEIKHDGYRTLVVIDGGKVRALLSSWPGLDRAISHRVVDACAKLPCKAAVIDGEVIVQDENGISDFDALRSAIHKAPHRIVFFAFDLLHLEGQDLRRTPLIDRRAALRKMIEPDARSPIQFSDHVECDGTKFFKAAAGLGLEGINSQAGPEPLSRRSFTQLVQDQEHGRGRIHPARHRPGCEWHPVGAAGVGSR
jgi:ATP-dependent DNA ligase